MKKLLLLLPLFIALVGCDSNGEKNKYEGLSDIDTCELLVQELLHNERAVITDIKVDDKNEFNGLLGSDLDLPISMILFKVNVGGKMVDGSCGKDESGDLGKSTNNIFSVTVGDKRADYSE